LNGVTEKVVQKNGRKRKHYSLPKSLKVRAGPERTSLSESLTLGIGSVLGEPMTFLPEKGVDLVHDVCAVRGSEGELTNRGSAVDLGLHTERAAFVTKPVKLGVSEPESLRA
jgi:hypothetical protein